MLHGFESTLSCPYSFLLGCFTTPSQLLIKLHKVFKNFNNSHFSQSQDFSRYVHKLRVHSYAQTLKFMTSQSHHRRMENHNAFPKLDQTLNMVDQLGGYLLLITGSAPRTHN